MDFEKAQQLQEEIVNDFLTKEIEQTRHFQYIHDRGNRPFQSLKSDLRELVNGSALIPTNEGWGVKLYTEEQVSDEEFKRYFGKTNEVINDPIGIVTILMQPLPGDYICYPNGSVGTLAAYVKDDSKKAFVLSNNHVLSNFCKGKVGDRILHPGQVNTGHNILASVSTLIPIHFTGSENEVDCGIAELHNFNGDFSALPGVGLIPGTTEAVYEMDVHKTGYKTKLTRGIVKSLSAIIKVDYQSGFFRRKSATFRRQIEVQPHSQYRMFSDVGDSGSLLMDSNTNKATGLIFAGSTNGTTFANPINRVLNALCVEIL
jgi:hypothetical protein